jgi:acyl dehydratase
MDTLTVETPLVSVGEELQARVRYTREQIARFAELAGDHNPLHHDHAAAERAHFGEVIASGQQIASQMMGMVASHFSRRDDGVPREMLVLNFNFAFKGPIFAEQDVHLVWRVSSIEPTERHGGLIGHVDGTACVAGRRCVIGRGTILVRRSAARTR